MGTKKRVDDPWMPGFRYEWAVGVLIDPAKGPFGPR